MTDQTATIPKGWKMTTLGEVADITSSKRIFADEYKTFGIPFFRGKEITEKFNGNSISTELFISEEKYIDIKNNFGVPEVNDILLTSVGTLGNPYLVEKDLKFYFKDGNLTWFRNYKNLLPKFLFYWIVSPQGKEILSYAKIGSTQEAYTISKLKGLLLVLPQLPEQSAIVAVLSSLDDKIELLREQNKTLEATAQAIFKEWFVDFNFPNATGKMIDSELGEIPEGWVVKGLSGIADFLNGLPLQKFPAMGETDYLPVVKIKELRSGITEGTDKAGKDVPSNYIVNDGDILFSWSGSLEVVIWKYGAGALNQHLFKVSSEKYPKWFFYLWLQQHLASFRSIAANKATTMGHIQRHHLDEAKVFVPRDQTLKTMDAVLSPLLAKVIKNDANSITLVSLRNSLLPKLMRGELRIKMND